MHKPHQRDSFPKDSLKEKRNHIIEMLRRSSEQEELALYYIQKSLVLSNELVEEEKGIGGL